jgi:hypothetical protein
MGQDITLPAETGSGRVSIRREAHRKFPLSARVCSSMNGRRERPDWVICRSCRAVYAPELVGAVACPRCGEKRWEPSAIPDGDEPLEPPLLTGAASAA